MLLPLVVYAAVVGVRMYVLLLHRSKDLDLGDVGTILLVVFLWCVHQKTTYHTSTSSSSSSLCCGPQTYDTV